jgi:hypothetical protein
MLACMLLCLLRKVLYLQVSTFITHVFWLMSSPLFLYDKG